VANCTTPAQYFHLLRRQARRNRVRPLRCSRRRALRLLLAASKLSDLTTGTFSRCSMIPTPGGSAHRRRQPDRVLHRQGTTTCSPRRQPRSAARHRPIEGLCTPSGMPSRRCWPGILGRKNSSAQEEPRNMGAWSYIAPPRRASPEGGVPYADTRARQSCRGIPAAHAAEQAIVKQGVGSRERSRQ
jgi:2-oxoglutarate dehydrogenase E1 component